MEIKRGHTYPQFIKILNHDRTGFKSDLFDLVVRFNNLCEQPLTKGLFIPCDETGNEIKKPIGYNTWLLGNGGADGIACVKYQEAEKKVIFEGDKIIHNSNCIEFKHSNNISVFYYPDEKEENDKILVFGAGYLDKFNTIGDLFQATNGQLITKNITV